MKQGGLRCEQLGGSVSKLPYHSDSHCCRRARLRGEPSSWVTASADDFQHDRVIGVA